MDSSGSIRNSYSKEKDFVKTVAGKIGISLSGSRAGLVLFGTYAELSIKLNQFDNTADFQSAVDQLRLMGSSTRIDRALTVADEQLFSVSNGMRLNVPKVLILLTDGKQDSAATAPSIAIKPFHDAGIKVIVIGIGPGVLESELRKFVLSSDDLYLPKDFEELNSAKFIQDIAVKSCEYASKKLKVISFLFLSMQK